MAADSIIPSIVKTVHLCNYKMSFSISALIIMQYLAFVHSFDVYPIDSSASGGRRYDGIGGLSGGGATSKLLVNYPLEQRDQILDYLFKPGFGASLQILKVEIGGDAQSTDGTEASHMHYPWDENYQRGYEWWLLVEAKKRNPDILLYCLPWAFPAWVGNGTRNPYNNPERTATYVIKYIQGAKKYYNLTMNFVGIWNERQYDIKYIKTLRKMLNDAGLNETRIVAADGTWEPISIDIILDKALAQAVDIIGVHYPGTKSSDAAVKTGKQLWSSEDYSTFNDNIGAGCWARILNQNYVNGNMTSTISWNLIASYYEALPYTRNGLMTADSPWSGFYDVDATIWMSAHTTQFVYPGWNYLAHGSGVSKLKHGGSMVSLVSFDSTQLTMVIETMSHNHSKCIRPALPEYVVTAQNVSLKLAGQFSSLFEVHVRYSKLGFDGEDSILFKDLGSVPVINGTINLSLGIDEVYTLTTLKTGTKGNFSTGIPSKKPFPLPYQDDFEATPIYKEPFNFSPQVGSFEVISSADPFHQHVLRQTVIENPIFWCLFIDLVFPMGLLGDYSWSDIYVEADTRVNTVNGTSGVFVAARISKGGCNSFAAEGIYYFLFPTQGMLQVTGDLARTKSLYKGPVKIEVGQWYKQGLLIKDGRAIGTLNGGMQFNISLPGKPAPQNGFVGLGTADYGLGDFDNLKITESSDGEKIILSQNRKLADYDTISASHLDININSGEKFLELGSKGSKILTPKVIQETSVFTEENLTKDDTLYFRSQSADDNE